MDTIKTADEYREEAASYRRAELESIERSDTDGFLSQWAYTQLAHCALHNAKVVEEGSAISEACFDLGGKLIATADDLRDGQYGRYFYIADDEDAARVGRFISPSNAQLNSTRVRNNAKKGVVVSWVYTAHLALGADGLVGADYDAIRAGHYEITDAE